MRHTANQIFHFETPVEWAWGPDVAVDFESFYKKGVHDIDTLGGHAYNRHPKSYPYLVAISDGAHLWVGHPEKFNWRSLEDRTLCAHNAYHDADVVNAGIERGAWPKFAWKQWICTADMAVYFCGHRNLAGALSALFKLELSKQTRTDADGKTWQDMLAEEIVLEDGTRTTFAKSMIDYAGDDTLCLKIWQEYGSRWPERERRISALTRERGWYGVRIDVADLKRCLSLCRRVVLDSTEKLPWVAAGKKPGSPKGVAEECRKSGIPCPPVKTGPNGDPEEAEEWLEAYGNKFPWVKALKDLRRGKKMLATLEKIESRIREDDTLPFSLLYYGAHTGRFAGTGGINFQNFNKEPLFPEHDPLGKGIDVRGLIIPREGKRFAIPDLSQIEPRGIHHLIGNEALLSQIRSGMAIYEAFARSSMGWKGGNLKKENKYLYNLAKAQVLALGYGAGWEKFISMALMPMYGNLDLCVDDDKVAMEKSLDKKFYAEEERVSEGGKKLYYAVEYVAGKHEALERFIVVMGPEGIPIREKVYGCNARQIVAAFRAANPLITGLWKMLDDAVREAAAEERDFVLDLPDGSTLTYRNCRFEKRRKVDKKTGEAYTKTEVRFDLGSRSEGTYGGKLCENLVQSFARHVFIEGVLRIEDTTEGKVLFTVHDEAIVEIDDDGTPLFEEVDGKMVRYVRSHDDGTALGRVLGALAQAPSWAQGLPVASEAVWADSYLK
jgi:hypothetical protein